METWADMKSTTAFRPEAAPAPGSTSSNRPATDSGTQKTRPLTDQEKEFLRGMKGWTEEMIKAERMAV